MAQRLDYASGRFSEPSPLLACLGLALLAASWLPGLGYYQPASAATWVILIVAGVLLLGGSSVRAPSKLEAVVAILLTLPVLWTAPGAYRTAPLLIVLGCAILVLEPPRRWLRGLGGAALFGGLVLLAQSLAMMAYEALTARSHELPMPLARFLGLVARLLGNDATVAATTPGGGGGVEIVLRTMRKAHRLGATWELLLDPVTLCLLAGGIVLVLIRHWNESKDPAAKAASPAKRAVGSIAALILCIAIWLPVRAGVLMALILHRALRTDFDAPLKVMDQFYSVWMLLLLVLPAALLAWRFVRLPERASDEEIDRPPRPVPNWLMFISPALVALAVSALTFASVCDPVGIRKNGRVIVDEYHSKWEPTTRPYDTTWYGHESGYNYAAMYDYSSRFYDMKRLMAPGVVDSSAPRERVQAPQPPPEGAQSVPAITDSLLTNCDVFILKCPTQRLMTDETESLRKFVASGGGILLVGEHTDVFGLGTNLNDVARPFKFQFRYDILFNIDDEHPFDYVYNKPLVPHPIVQRMPTLDFEGPCTIEPSGPGYAVMLAVGQRGERAHYYASNFMPPPEDRADARYGSWILLWSTKYGKGRVVAHADSTQWSNFSAFEAGKPESWIGMVEWLNHKNGGISEPRLALIVTGLVLLLAALVTSVRLGGAWLVSIAAGMCAFAISASWVAKIHRDAMPVPAYRSGALPMVKVGIDRTVSDALLSKGGFIGGANNGYGIFERWILRLGWFTQRGSGKELFDGKDMVVFLLPGKDVSDEFRQQLTDYVRGGGRALIVDALENPHSTANSLLHPFGLEMHRPYTMPTGDIVSTIGLPAIQYPNVFEVTGGQPIATMGTRTVAATRSFGKGSVTAIGFGGRFNDSNYGVTGDVVPNDELTKLYEWQYGLLRHLMGEQATTTRPTTQSATGASK